MSGEISESEGSLFSSITGTGGKIVTAANGIAFGIALYEVARKWEGRVRSTYEHTVSVPIEDDIYEDVHTWVLARLSSKQQRSLVARTYLSRDDGTVSEHHMEKRSGRLRLFYDGARAVQVTIDGQQVRVQVEQREVTTAKRNGDFSLRSKDRILFHARNEAGRLAVLDFLSKLAHEKHASTTNRLYMAMPWGDWRPTDVGPPRSLDTVILEAGQKERVLSDLQTFLAEEQHYVNAGLPWHRGYLLHGPPGTGKTSLAKALASHLGLDLYFLSLSDLREDTHLTQLLQQMQERSVLILEDVDIVHAAKTRDDSGGGISLSGLLQALDGVITPHGLITIMTTNNIGVLDDALIRTGRADMIERLDYLDQNQADRLAGLVVGRPVRLPKIPVDLSPADLIEPAKGLLGDPDAAERAIKESLGAR